MKLFHHQESITYRPCITRKLLILRSRNSISDRLLDRCVTGSSVWGAGEPGVSRRCTATETVHPEPRWLPPPSGPVDRFRLGSVALSSGKRYSFHDDCFRPSGDGRDGQTLDGVG